MALRQPISEAQANSAPVAAPLGLFPELLGGQGDRGSRRLELSRRLARHSKERAFRCGPRPPRNPGSAVALPKLMAGQVLALDLDFARQRRLAALAEAARRPLHHSICARP